MSAVTRRRFLHSAGALTAAGLVTPVSAAPPGKPAPFKLGLVTYNVAKDWDVPTLLKICKSAGVAAVELRTTHKHGVEPALSKAQRADVRKRFADAGVVIWGAGTVCEFHAPDPAVVAKNIGYGYVRNTEGVPTDWLTAGRYELEVATERVPAAIHLAPLYDPKMERIKC